MYIGKCRYYDIITEIILKLVSFQVYSARTELFSFHFEITDYDDDIFLSLGYGIQMFYDHSMYVGSCRWYDIIIKIILKLMKFRAHSK